MVSEKPGLATLIHCFADAVSILFLYLLYLQYIQHKHD